MSLPSKKVLLVGATSGIGAALADTLVENGTFVIAVGRRKGNLDKFVDKHGADKAAAAVVDILRLGSIPEFAASTLKAHPEIDCVFLDAGVQRGVNFTKAETVDLDIIHDELLVNYLSHVHLTKAFLSHPSKQGKQTALLYTTSQLGLAPRRRCPNYSGSKAAIHGFILELRAQLRDASSGVRIVEVYPPAVQTELHDAKKQPDLKNEHAIGMPVGEFVDEVYRRWIDGEHKVPVGTAKPMFDAFEKARQEYFVF
ncbi:putative oxidoreductase [Colletotrichum shisoi]|uniref:Putative oxidoreductase n=1 Tax=Colletotrichum shisoi TaxID=2078593 RepID=A0A5Q4BQY3_9PEZI|nr:putative oxidoreductase [Colletotrichum shisoi]